MHRRLEITVTRVFKIGIRISALTEISKSGLFRLTQHKFFFFLCSSDRASLISK